MTTPLPTDEELERWAREVTVKPATPRESALQVAVEGLLAYVRHLRGEVEDQCRRADVEEAEAEGFLQDCEALAAERDELYAEVSDLRKQLEAARREALALEEYRLKRFEQAMREADETTGRTLPKVPLVANPVTPLGEAVLRGADGREVRIVNIGDPVDDEARLSDPKRHPYRDRLGGSLQCADCGEYIGAHDLGKGASMSEHKKRLTDSEAERVWDEQFDEPDGFDRMVRIQCDHLQAREDVKRLAERLRERLGGRCCEELRVQCVACATDEALLSEMEP